MTKSPSGNICRPFSSRLRTWFHLGVLAVLPVCLEGQSYIPPTPATLDASQFPGADICHKINAAYLALPVTGGTIDARGFSDPQFCTMNPFSANISANPTSTFGPRSFVLLLGRYEIFTSVPWVTPGTLPYLIKGVSGAGTGAPTTGGSWIIACNPAGALGCGGSSNPAFPGTLTLSYILRFTYPHAPFSGSPGPTIYQALINWGGGGSKGECTDNPPTNFSSACLGDATDPGWGHDLFNARLEDVNLDLNQVANTFGFYTKNGQENTGWRNGECHHWGQNSACFFADNADQTDAGSQTSHFSVDHIQATANGGALPTYTFGSQCSITPPIATVVVTAGAVSGANISNSGNGCPNGNPSTLTCTVTGGGGSGATCTTNVSGGHLQAINITAAGTGYNLGDLTNSWGIVAQGSSTFISLTGGNCADPPYAYPIVSGGSVSSAQVTYNGRTGCTVAPSCSLNSASGSGQTCTASVSGGVVSGVTISGSGSHYVKTTHFGPDYIGNVTLSGASGGRIAGGLYIEGFQNPEVAYLHAEWTLPSGVTSLMGQLNGQSAGAAVRAGGGNAPVLAGFFHNVDTANDSGNVFHYGAGGDNNGMFISGAQATTSTPVVQDDQNCNPGSAPCTNGGTTLTGSTWQRFEIYNPGGMIVPTWVTLGSSQDAGISRTAASTLTVGNGQNGNAGGTLQANNLVVGTSVGGHINNGVANKDVSGVCSGTATTCSVTFQTSFASTPVCVVTPTSSGTTSAIITAQSTTGFTVTYAPTGAKSFNYLCIGNPN